ncbi:MAG: ABC transporter ATP-binding protein [Ancalomicrobiaceae bacterium]|nr:ABC transporter ATP-binding protein [Ancalomicrobiaceae bacterium]
MTTSTPLLQVSKLSVAHSDIEAVSEVDLTVGEGQIVTVIGPNGAGKTTLLSALIGLLPSRGTISVDGEMIERPEIDRMIARGLSLVPETRALFGPMTVEDNLVLGAFRRRRDAGFDRAKALDDVYARFPRLWERRRQAAETLSGGEQQMLALGRALIGRPRLLMLDEPSLGLAPLLVRELFRMIEGLRAAGVSILLVEQNARAALRVADYAYVLELGRVGLEGPADVLAGDPRVISAYLGRGADATRGTSFATRHEIPAR